jgi:uncharacterized protein with PIN domain
VCGEDLLLGRIPYQVQKVWRGGEVVFEMAVCARCAANLMREFSQESMAAMQAFHQQHYRPEDTVALCHFCRKAVTAQTEHEVGAACAGARLLRPAVVICGECNGRMQERLSRKTREAWGDFVEQNFPGVPTAMEPETTPLMF